MASSWQRRRAERQSTRMEFGLLGPLRVAVDCREVLPRRAKQRALLALLLLQAGDVVSVDRLIDALWEERPPPSALNALQGHVSALRRLLGPERVETRPPGYVFHLEDDELDLRRFERLLEESRSASGEARRAALTQALRLFRGEPLADFRYEAFA